MALKLYSDIYPPDIKPVRDGWYLTSVKEGWCTVDLGVFMWWGRGNWRLVDAEYPPSFASARYWRGIAFDPDDAEPFEDEIISVSSQRIVTIRGAFIPGAEVA
jgi:hypothetical protein